MITFLIAGWFTSDFSDYNLTTGSSDTAKLSLSVKSFFWFTEAKIQQSRVERDIFTLIIFPLYYLPLFYTVLLIWKCPWMSYYTNMNVSCFSLTSLYRKKNCNKISVSIIFNSNVIFVMKCNVVRLAYK